MNYNATALIARILMSVMFLVSGISKITGFDGTVGYIGSVGLPMPTALAAAAAAVELLASLALIIGWKTRWAALALAVFTAAATVFFHNFWAMPASEQMMQQISFVKNLAVIGGLLLLASAGPGAWSVDRR
jgi:putative oxidoreductase